MLVLKYLVKIPGMRNGEITTRPREWTLVWLRGMRLSLYADPVQTDQFLFEQVVVARCQRNKERRKLRGLPELGASGPPRPPILRATDGTTRRPDLS